MYGVPIFTVDWCLLVAVEEALLPLPLFGSSVRSLSTEEATVVLRLPSWVFLATVAMAGESCSGTLKTQLDPYTVTRYP